MQAWWLAKIWPGYFRLCDPIRIFICIGIYWPCSLWTLDPSTPRERSHGSAARLTVNRSGLADKLRDSPKRTKETGKMAIAPLEQESQGISKVSKEPGLKNRPTWGRMVLFLYPSTCVVILPTHISPSPLAGPSWVVLQRNLIRATDVCNSKL